jgi:hypothetical protein
MVTAIAALPLRADDRAPAKASAPADDYPAETLKTSDGCELSLPAARGRVATVLVCMSVECPISNEYLPAIKDVAARYRQRGVSLVAINPNAGETLAVMGQYARQHKLLFPFARDEGGKIARRLLFNVTPEVCVFDAAGKIVYRGRIDDRYRAGGGQQGAKRSPDLARALDEVIAGKPVSQARTKPVGCPIQLSAPPAGGQ